MIPLIACASSTAVDLVFDSSSPACTDMLNRFFNIFVVAPKQFISDNEGAFISEETQFFIKNRNTKWAFNKQAAHHGQVNVLKETSSL